MSIDDYILSPQLAVDVNLWLNISEGLTQLLLEHTLYYIKHCDIHPLSSNACLDLGAGWHESIPVERVSHPLRFEPNFYGSYTENTHL